VTYTTALSAGPPWRTDVTLFIDGLPFLFGTRAGLSLDISSIVTNPGAYSTITSVNAIQPDSISFGGQKLDYGLSMVPPGGFAMQLRRRDGIPDESWTRYFRRRTQPQPRIVTAGGISKTASTFAVENATGLTAGYLYVNRETIYWEGTLVGQTLSDIVRNTLALPGSRAEVHQFGARLSSVPHLLKGRMAFVHLWIDGEVSYFHGYGKISNSPTDNPDTDTWSLEFDDIMSAFSRRCAVGLPGAAVTNVESAISSTENVVKLSQDGSTRQFAPSATDDGSLLITGKLPLDGGDTVDLTQVAPINSFDGTGSSAKPIVKVTDFFAFTGSIDGVQNTNMWWYWVKPEHMRRVYVFTRYPMLAALKVLLSDTGDGSNHATYDVLFGISNAGAGASTVVASEETEIRFGAATPSGLIDVTTLETFASINVPGWCYVFGARGEEDQLEFMREVARALKGYWIVKDGLLSFKLYDATYETDTVDGTATTDNILSDTSRSGVDDESEAVSAISTSCNFDPFDGEFKGKLNVIYTEMQATLANDKAVAVHERKGLLVDLPGSVLPPGLVATPATVTEAYHDADRYFARRSRGLRKWKLNLPWSSHRLVPGDKITLTWDQLSDFAGGTVSDQTVEITARELRYHQNMITVEVTEIWTGRLINSTARVSSWDAINSRFNLDASGKYSSGGAVARWFAIGWKCRLWDATDNFATTFDFTVSAIPSDNVLTPGASPPFTAAVGDIITADTYDDANDTTANAKQSLGQHSYMFMADGTLTLGAALDAGHGLA
jgi:hypothetical protein